MVFQFILQLISFFMSFFGGDIQENGITISKPVRLDGEYSHLVYMEMNKTTSEHVSELAMATIYNEGFFTGKCSSSIYRHYYTPNYKRLHTFSQNPGIPKDEQPYNSWYRDSGYDRGHISPAADNTYNYDAMTVSFYVTNIAP